MRLFYLRPKEEPPIVRERSTPTKEKEEGGEGRDTPRQKKRVQTNRSHAGTIKENGEMPPQPPRRSRSKRKTRRGDHSGGERGKTHKAEGRNQDATRKTSVRRPQNKQPQNEKDNGDRTERTQTHPRREREDPWPFK